MLHLLLSAHQLTHNTFFALPHRYWCQAAFFVLGLLIPVFFSDQTLKDPDTGESIPGTRNTQAGNATFHVMYWLARSWPLGRFPVFLMGCIGALERLDERPPNPSAADVEISCVGCCCSDGHSEKQTRTPATWGAQADKTIRWYLFMLSICWICNARGGLGGIFGFLGRVFYECFLPNMFLHLILSLSRCNNEGFLARFCRKPAMQFMGDISMSFYMIHMNLFGTFALIAGGDLSGADPNPMPFWIVPASLSASLLFGWFGTTVIEKPLETLFRGSKRQVHTGRGEQGGGGTSATIAPAT